MAKRKNMPGYTEAKDSLGRTYWKPISDSSSIKSQALSNIKDTSTVEDEGRKLSDFEPHRLFDIDVYGDNPIDLSEIDKGKSFYLDDEEWNMVKVYPYDESSHMDIIVTSPSGNYFKVQHSKYTEPNVFSVTPERDYHMDMSITEEVDSFSLTDTPEKKEEFLTLAMDNLFNERETLKRNKLSAMESIHLASQVSQVAIERYYEDIEDEVTMDEMTLTNPQEGSTLYFDPLRKKSVDENNYDFSHWENLEMGNGRSYAEVFEVNTGDETYFIQNVSSSEYGPFTSESLVYHNGEWIIKGGAGVRLFKEVGVGGYKDVYVEDGEFETD